MRCRLALRRDAAGGHPLGEDLARERSFRRERALDDRDGALGRAGGDAELLQPPARTRLLCRPGEGEQPPVVLAPHEVERPAHEPRDDERAVAAEGGPDVLGADVARRARAERQPRCPQILRLHREEPADDRGGRPARRGVQPLGGDAAGTQLRGRHRRCDAGGRR